MIFVRLSFVFLFFITYSQKMILGYKNTELLLCLIPILLLLLQIIPSLLLLWKRNLELDGNDLRIKVIGHQWYWSYELGDIGDLAFDSYIKPINELRLGELIFLEVDNRLILPVRVRIRFILSSSDVIHSWALPSFFIKLDCISGILTVFSYFFNIVGLYFGQCSEICGANHSFIPVVLEVTLFDFFKEWLKTI